MWIFDFMEKYFELLKTAQGWSLIIFGIVLGMMLYHSMHQSELSELALKNERLESITKQQILTGKELSSLQIKFLQALVKYQDENDLNKIVINKNGLIFDDKAKSLTKQNVIVSFINKNPAIFSEKDLETLIYSMPEKYLKIIPESRWDSPYVITYLEPAKQLSK